MSDIGIPLSELRTLLKGQVLALCAVVLLAMIGMGILAPIMPLYLRTLGATGTAVGLVMAVYGLGEGIFGFIWGLLTDRIGITVPLAVQTFGGAVCMVALASIPVLGAVFVLRFVAAAVGAAIFPTGRGYLSNAVPPRSKGLAMALFGFLVSGGISIGSSISGLLVDRWGFPVAFLTAAVLSSVSGVIVVTRLRGARIVSNQPIGRDGPSLSGVPSAETGRTFTWPILILSIIVTLVAVAATSVMTFVPLLMTDVAGLAATDVGVVFGVSGLVSLVLLIPIGRLSDRVGRKRVLSSGILLMLLGLLGLAYARSFWPILILVTLSSVGRWATDPSILSLLSDITPLRHQGRSQGIYVAAMDVGIIVGPVITGVIWDRAGPQPSYILCAAVAGLAVLVTLLLVREKEWLASVVASASVPT